MKKPFIGLVCFTLTLLSCSTEDDAQESCKEIWGATKNCSGTDCNYKLRYGYTEEDQVQVEVNQATYDYYSERFDNEETVCFEGMK
jgi:hypothetical protein